MTDSSNDRKLDDLFRDYRNACPDMDGGAAFTPRLWQKIESRKGVPFLMGRFTRMFVTAAAALCVAMGLFLTIPQSQTFLVSQTYLESLDNEHPLDLMAYVDADTEEL